LSAFTSSAFSLFTTGFGVFAGACTPYHAVASNFGKPDSAMVGTSGNAGERFSPVCASARSFPDLICGSVEEKPLNMSCMCPPRRSVTA
jgi:hypothetical protein